MPNKSLENPDRLLVISTLRSGGGERVAVTLANEWIARGRTVEIVTFDDPNNAPAYKLDSQITLTRLGVWGPTQSKSEALFQNFRRIFALRRLLKKRRPAITIAFLSRTSITTILATIGTNLAVIVSEHSVPNRHPTGRLWKLLQTAIYPLAAGVVVPSKGLAALFNSNIQKKLIPVANPVLFSESALIDRYNRHQKNQKCNLIAVGRLEDVKGFDLMIDAFSLAKKSSPTLELTIWGEGSKRNSLEQRCRDRGVANSCHLPGFTDNILSEYKPENIFLLTSKHEAFPVALLEAMAAGMSVISVDCPVGPREIISHDIDGILVSSHRNADEIAMQIVALAENPDKRLKLGATAQKNVRDSFCPTKIVDSWDHQISKWGY